MRPRFLQLSMHIQCIWNEWHHIHCLWVSIWQYASYQGWLDALQFHPNIVYNLCALWHGWTWSQFFWFDAQAYKSFPMNPQATRNVWQHILTIKTLTFGVRVPIYQSAYYQNPHAKSKGFIMPKVGQKDLPVPGLHTKKSWGLQDAPSQFCDLLRQFAWFPIRRQCRFYYAKRYFKRSACTRHIE